MNAIASLADRRRAQLATQAAELELDIAVHMATVAMIHMGWKDPEFRAAFERMTYSETYAHICGVLRTIKATTPDGEIVPLDRALHAMAKELMPSCFI